MEQFAGQLGSGMEATWQVCELFELWLAPSRQHCWVALVPARAQQAGAPQAPQAQAPAPAGRGGGGLNDACGGRSGNPTEACPNDVSG